MDYVIFQRILIQIIVIAFYIWLYLSQSIKTINQTVQSHETKSRHFYTSLSIIFDDHVFVA